MAWLCRSRPCGQRAARPVRNVWQAPSLGRCRLTQPALPRAPPRRLGRGSRAGPRCLRARSGLTVYRFGRAWHLAPSAPTGRSGGGFPHVSERDLAGHDRSSSVTFVCGSWVPRSSATTTSVLTSSCGGSDPVETKDLSSVSSPGSIRPQSVSAVGDRNGLEPRVSSNRPGSIRLQSVSTVRDRNGL